MNRRTGTRTNTKSVRNANAATGKNMLSLIHFLVLNSSDAAALLDEKTDNKLGEPSNTSESGHPQRAAKLISET